METLECPACLNGLLDDGNEPCIACRDRGGRAARPLLLLERELQARIEAKTASRYRQRRRAAKAARRIAALPPTVFEPQVAKIERDRPVVVADAPGAPVTIDLPATAVLTVRSTSVLADNREPGIEVEQPVPQARARVPRPAVASKWRAAPERIVAAAPAAKPTRVEKPKPVERVRAVVEPTRVEKPKPVERVRAVVEPPESKRSRPVAKAREVPEPVRVEKPRPVKKVREVPEPVQVETPKPVKQVREVAESTRVEKPKPRVEAPAADPAPTEPEARLASVTRIGPQGTNPVWKDRVFNSARRRPETVTWPRPRPFESPAEPAIDRYGRRARG